MKNRFNKILLVILMLFSVFVVKAELNPAYTEFQKHTLEEKSKSGFIPEEYVSYYDIKPSNIFSYKRSFRANTNIIPSSYNLTNVDGIRLITEVKDQNPWGLCWAFSTNSMVESYHLKKYNQYYNFSENVPGYIGKYYNDIPSISSGNTLFNAVKYWFLGNSPISEDVFGSYFTTEKDKDVKDYLDSNYVEVDVQDVKFFKVLNLSDVKSSYTATQVKNIVTDYNKTIKNHIMNYGAVSTGIYMDYMNYNTNFLYNSGKPSSGVEGHAVTIVGWDDNFGEVDINGTKLKGSWIVMNSWGENYYPYFYVSYYDVDVVNNMIGTTSSKVKEWDNVYNSFTRAFINTSGTATTYIYEKGEKEELLDNVKLLYYNTTELNVNVSVSDGFNTYDLGNKTISKGLTTFQGLNNNLIGDKIYITISSSDSNFLNLYPFILNGVFTKSTTNTRSLELVGIATNDYTGKKDNKLKFDVVTKNIVTATNYDIAIYDENNNDISSKFTINVTNSLVNGTSLFDITLKNDNGSKSIKVVTSIGNLTDSVTYYLQGNGTSSDPYIIASDSDMDLLQTYPKAYFILGNDINMNEATRTNVGSFYNSGEGWSNRNFSGVLDGNGYKISNLYSKDGGLFNHIDGATIKNLWLDNFEINSSYESGILGNDMYGDSVISNVYISNSKISNDSYAGGLFTNIENGIINNVHMKSNSIYSKTASGGVSATMNNPSSSITLSNIFIEDSYIMTDSNGITGKLVGNLIYEGDINSLNIINLQYNKANTKNNNSFKNASVMIEKTSVNVTQNGETISYNPYTNNIISVDNSILDSSEIQNKDNFSNYDFNNIWGFKDSLYLKLFNNEKIIEEDIEDIVISFNTYKIKDNVIYGLYPNTKKETIINDMIIDDKLTYNIYNKNGSLVTNNNLETNSYIMVSNGLINKKYYFAVYGDVNGDGRISITDVYLVADYIIVSNNLKSNYLSNNAQIISADVNKDGRISITDVYKIADYVINPSLGF